MPAAAFAPLSFEPSALERLLAEVRRQQNESAELLAAAQAIPLSTTFVESARRIFDESGLRRDARLPGGRAGLEAPGGTRCGGVPARYLVLNIQEITERQAAERAQLRSGTGAGLPLCRKIVESYGEAIEVESEEGPWAIFRFDPPGEQ